MPKLAILTIGILHEPWGSPRVQGFVDRIPAVFEQAEASSGFVDRSRLEAETGRHSWGDVVYPPLVPEEERKARLPATVSVWEDIESVCAYAYRGAHGEAMRHRKEWFVSDCCPGFVCWWIADDHQPSWVEAAERYERMRHDGPSATAFTFKEPYGPDGRHVRIRQELVEERIARNAG